MFFKNSVEDEYVIQVDFRPYRGPTGAPVGRWYQPPWQLQWKKHCKSALEARGFANLVGSVFDIRKVIK